MKLESGQSFFEVVIALGITALVLVAIVVPATVSIKNSNLSQNKARATRHVQEALEWLRGERDTDWDTFAGNAATSTWCLSALSWTSPSTVGTCTQTNKINGTIFTREVDFGFIDSATYEVTVKVMWTDTAGLKEVRSSTYLTDWRVQ